MCKLKSLDSLTYMCTEVDKLMIRKDIFFFSPLLSSSLYLYLQDDRRMCLVDTRRGVASGEGLFLYCTFVPLTVVIKFTSQRTVARPLTWNHPHLLLPFFLSHRHVNPDKQKVWSPSVFCCSARDYILAFWDLFDHICLWLNHFSVYFWVFC